MSYVVLARKYRPPDFTAMVGQEHVVQALSNALTQRRLHHAYLFTGTRGVGKTTIARILAKSLNCTGPDGSGDITAQPCGVCQACRDIDIGRFIDYVELDAASNRGVDEISQLLDQAVYKPVVGRFKVYMIDEVHMLSPTAFNAMLKTLEEPPDHLKFVLATTDPQKVPATVLSRCLQFNLRPMAPQTIQDHLVEVLDRESIAAEPGALRLLSRAARGSMRDALSLADQAIAFGAGSLAEEGVRQMLGAVDRGHAVRIVDALATGDGAAVIAAVDALRSLGLSANGALEEMAGLLQQMAVLQAVPDAADAADSLTSELQRLAGLLAADEVQLIYSIVLHGRSELGLAPDEYSGLVMVLLRILAFKPPADSRDLPSRGAAPASAPVRNAAVPGEMPLASMPDPAPARAEPARAIAPRTASRSRQALPAAPPAPAAAVAARPVLRAGSVRASTSEPPPWLDIPDEEEEPHRARPGMNRSSEDGLGVETAGAAGVRKPPPTVLSTSSAGPEPEPRSSPPPELTAGVSRLPEPTAAVTSLAEPSSPVSSLPEPMAPVPSLPEPMALGERWALLVRQLIDSGSIGAMVRELAVQSQCVAMDTSARPATCRLRVDREMLRAPVIVEKLQAALSSALGRDVRLDTEPGAADDSPARRDSAERDRRQGEAEQIIQDDPLVRALMAQYKTARIVPGSVKPNG